VRPAVCASIYAIRASMLQVLLINSDDSSFARRFFADETPTESSKEEEEEDPANKDGDDKGEEVVAKRVKTPTAELQSPPCKPVNKSRRSSLPHQVILDSAKALLRDGRASCRGLGGGGKVVGRKLEPQTEPNEAFWGSDLEDEMETENASGEMTNGGFVSCSDEDDEDDDEKKANG